MFDCFSGINIEEVLEDLDVHSPINAMMAEHTCHALFDKLDLWLTPAHVRRL